MPNRNNAVSVRRLLLRRLSALGSMVVLLAGATTFVLARYFAHDVFDQWLFDSASTLASQVKATAGQARVDLPRSAVEMLEFDAVDRVFYDVVTADGRRIFGNAALPAPPPGLAAAVPVFYDANVLGRHVRVVAMQLGSRVPAAGDPTTDTATDTANNDGVIVQVAETTNKRDALVTQILLSILLPQVVLMLLGALAIWYAVSSGLRSLDQIAGGLARFTPGSPQPLIDPREAPVEIQPLLQALHQVIARLAEAQAIQQRFIVNASHQLRTPLAALQVQAERALREPDPVKHLEALESVLKTMNRLRHLSHQLLMLARAEPVANPTMTLRRMDLAELARLELEHWTDAAIERGIDLGYEGPPAGVAIDIDGEPQLLRELISNLVDNAIRYAGPDARVTLSLTQAPEPELAVEDDGPGIPENERALVLERFYRRAQSPSEGSGLGLAIAREIAERHGAALRIDSGSGGNGLRVSVRFQRVARSA